MLKTVLKPTRISAPRLRAAALLALLLAANAAQAQHQPEAKQLLDKAAATVKNWKTVQIDFTAEVTSVAAPESVERHQGKLWRKGNKYRFDFMDAQTYFDGKQKWVYMPEVQEVNYYATVDAKESSLLDSPDKIFEIYATGFKYQIVNEATEGKETLVDIDLVPEDPKSDFFKLKATISKTTNRLLKMKYFGKTGQRVTITVDKYTPGAQLTDSFFAFDPKANPDAEVIDMTE